MSAEFKTVINPKTGKMETVTVYNDADEKLKRTRRELRDMLDGNTQFHHDELGPKPKPVAPPAPAVDYDDDGY